MIAVVVIGLLVPVLLAYLAVGHEPGLVFPIITCGAAAFTLMGVNIIVAARWPGIDRWFGGLDRAYQVHKWTGIGALVLAAIHQQFPISNEGEVVTGSFHKLSVEVAEYAFWPFVILVLISFFKRFWPSKYELPWRVWRWSHRLLGVIFVLLAFHQFFVKAPFDNNTLLANWLNGIAIVGIISWIWTLIGPYMRSKRYVVANVTEHPAATIVDLEPERGGVKVSPGSFAFVNFSSQGLSEVHPFTVSKVGPRGEIQFSIRGLGDFTRRVRHSVRRGDGANVEGGYGRFHHERGGEKQIWVAAGIGVTPFLAWSDTLTPENAPEVHMVYCTRNEDDAVGLDRLRAAAERCPSVSFRLFCSDTDGRLDAEKLVEGMPFDVSEASFWFCGPPPLRVALEKGLGAMGKKPRAVHYERFEFR